MNYACICLYIMACRVYNKFSVWVSTRGNSLSLSLLLFSLHVAISCCYMGIDYAGPISIKYGYVRKPTIVKSYISVLSH